MKQQLEAIRAAAVAAMEGAANADDLEALRVQYLGKKGELTAVLKQMGKLSAEERPVIGQLANEIRAKLETPSSPGRSSWRARPGPCASSPRRWT